MGNQQDHHIVGYLQLVQQVVKQQQARLIHTGDRLIQYQQIGLGKRGHAQQYPLQLTAGQTAQLLIQQPVGVEAGKMGSQPFSVLFPRGEGRRASARSETGTCPALWRGTGIQSQALGT